MEKEQTNIIDEGLFEKIANGDDAAFTELYYASYRQIYGFLVALTKNKEDAEDLLQNTYIRIRNGSHLYRKQGTPMTWMCAVAKNQFLDFVRKKSKGWHSPHMSTPIIFLSFKKNFNRCSSIPRLICP